MKTTRILTSVIAAAVIFTAAAAADTISSVSQVEQTALMNNLDYKTAVLEVKKSENALEGTFKLDSSSIGLSGSYGSTDGNLSADDLSWKAAAALPVIEQLSLSAAVDQDLTGTFGLNFSPLNHSGTAELSVLDYHLKIEAAAYKAKEITDSAVAAYLEWAAAKEDYKIQSSTVEVKKTLYEDERVRYDKGESDLDAVRSAFTDWSESRTALNTALNSLQNAETELYAALNVDPETTELVQPAEETLQQLITELQKHIDSAKLSVGDSYAVQCADAAVKSYEAQLKNTWLFEPDFTLSGSLSISPDSSVPAMTATAAVSFGLDSWKADERDELSDGLEISRSQALQTMNSEQLKLKQAGTSVENASINYEVAETELEQAKELAEEARILYSIGEYSAAELEETELQYSQSQNNLFKAAAEHYKALRALSAYSN